MKNLKYFALIALSLIAAQAHGYRVYLINRTNSKMKVYTKQVWGPRRTDHVGARKYKRMDTGGYCIKSIYGKRTAGRKDCMGAACACQGWIFTKFNDGTKWLDSIGMANHKMRGVCSRSGSDFLKRFMRHCPANNPNRCKSMRKATELWW